MTMMDPERSFTGREEQQLLDGARAVLRTAFPRPDRADCPPRKELEDLAFRRRGLSGSTALVDHLGCCSPCFEQYSQHRARCKRRNRLGYFAGGIAAVVVLGLLALVPTNERQPPPSVTPPTNTARRVEAPSQAVRLTLDLAKRGIARGDAPSATSAAPIFHLPCKRLQIAIHLPTGSEDGQYDVALTPSGGTPVVHVSGDARLVNYVEVLEVELDLSNATPGKYNLAIRRREQPNWRTYPVTVDPKERQ